MAAVVRIGGKWRAQIRRTGYKSVARTFTTAKEAHDWAHKTESEIDAGEIAGIGDRIPKSRLVPGTVVEYLDRRGSKFREGVALVVGVSAVNPPHYTVRVAADTGHEHTRRLSAGQIKAICRTP